MTGRPAVVALQGVSKRFYRRNWRHFLLSEWLERPTADAFWAIEDVDLEIRSGERVGVIGRNGAGKTTLLRIVSGLLRPTRGLRIVNGSTLAVSEVQGGLHRELTGRENMPFLALLAGITRSELEAKLDGILAFAGLEEAALDTPVKNYSAGMAIRLALSVALSADADVLLMDEGLISTDAAFRARVRGRLREYVQHGRSGVFVTDDVSELENECDRLIYLRAGRVAASGVPREVLAAYDRDLMQRVGTREAS